MSILCIGQTVWFWKTITQKYPFAAVVAAVIDDNLINIGYVDALGINYNAQYVPFIPDDEEKPNAFYCQRIQPNSQLSTIKG